MTLTTNRYGQVTPSTTNELGSTISCPFYVSPTTDKKKELLNAFRSVKAKQAIEAGFDPAPKPGTGGVSVQTNVNPPTTPIEHELGITEENLRLMLFSRQGLHERLVVKLQELTGVEVFTREDAQQTFDAWLNYLFNPDENKGTTSVSKKTQRRTGGKKAAEAVTA